MAEELFFLDLRKLANGLGDKKVLARHIAHSIASQRRYRWVGLYEVTSTEIGMIASTGATPPAFPCFPATQGLCGVAVASRTLINSGDVQKDPRWLTTFGSTRSEIIVPVFEQNLGRPIGLIDVESDQLNAFTSDDERFLTSCASVLATLYQ